MQMNFEEEDELEDEPLATEDKEILRWDYQYSNWRVRYRGWTKKSNIFLRKCFICGDEHFASKIKSSCWDCSSTRHAALRENTRIATTLVQRAIKDGILKKLDGSIPCVDCGKPAKVYDHREYARPLDVHPVCHRCNTMRGPAKENDPLVFKRFGRNLSQPPAKPAATIPPLR